MTTEEAIEYWEGLRKTFSSQLEKEENHFGRMHLQTTIDVLDTTISALRAQQQPNAPLTNADRIRSMTDQELVEFIHEPFCDKRTYEECTISYCGVCSQCILDWLQQPAEEERA